jgi:histidine triad (HIT) family protein
MSVPSEQHFLPYIRGEKQHFVIAETSQFMAVIEEKPLKEGHCVVFPKKVQDTWTDLSDLDLAELMTFAKSVAQAIQKTVPCVKVGMAVIGLQVRHVHIHLVPIHSADDLNFTRTKLTPPEEALQATALRIRQNLT